MHINLAGSIQHRLAIMNIIDINQGDAVAQQVPAFLPMDTDVLKVSDFQNRFHAWGIDDGKDLLVILQSSDGTVLVILHNGYDIKLLLLNRIQKSRDSLACGSVVL